MVPYRLAAKAPREFPLIRNIRRNLMTIDQRVEEGAIYQMLTYASCSPEGLREGGLAAIRARAWTWSWNESRVMGSYRRGDVWNMFKTSQAGYDMILYDDNVDLSIHSVDV